MMTRRRGSWPLLALAAFLAALPLTPLARGGNSMAAGDTIAITGRISSAQDVLYLIDLGQMTLSVYRMGNNVPPGLVWEATRSIRFDVRLRTPYNLPNQEKLPQAVRQEVEQERRLRALQGAAATAEPAATPVSTRPEGLLALTGQYRQNEEVLYLINPATRVICAYRFNPTEKLVFLSARHYEWDRQLSDYNTKGWAPARVKNIVLQEEFEQRLRDRQGLNPPTGRATPPPARPTAPPLPPPVPPATSGTVPR